MITTKKIDTIARFIEATRAYAREIDALHAAAAERDPDDREQLGNEELAAINECRAILAGALERSPGVALILQVPSSETPAIVGCAIVGRTIAGRV